MKNLRHTSSLIQCTTITLALPAIGNKGVVGSKIKKFFYHSLADLQVYNGLSRLKEKARTSERYTQVSTQEIGNIINPLEIFYSKGSGTIHSKKENIEPPMHRHKRNKHHRGL